MEKKSVRQFSLLGLALMGVSALTAAIVPSKAAPLQTNSVNDGTAKQFSGGDNAVQAVISCVNQAGVKHCHLTVSVTTGVGAFGTLVQSAGGRFYDTQGNTSVSITVGAVDTTSVLIRIN